MSTRYAFPISGPSWQNVNDSAGDIAYSDTTASTEDDGTLNPVVAVLLGNLLRNELITLTILVGGIVVVLGIALVVLGETKKELIKPET